MAIKKTPPSDKRKSVAKTPAAAKPAAESRSPKAKAAPAVPPPKRPAGPTAGTCPLVLDGEVEAGDFSPSDCLTCSEFDCRFCRAEEGSGTLRSRLFAVSETDDADDDFGGGADFPEDEEHSGEEPGGEGEGEDDFP